MKNVNNKKIEGVLIRGYYYNLNEKNSILSAAADLFVRGECDEELYTKLSHITIRGGAYPTKSNKIIKYNN